MSFRRVISVVAMTGALATLPTVASQAAPKGGCPYPPNRPVLVLDLSPQTTTATRSVTAFGQFSQNNCGIGKGHIKIQRRYTRNGTPFGKWSTVATATTDSHGLYAARIRPNYTTQVRARFAAAGKFPTTTSNVRLEKVRVKVTRSVTFKHACKVRIAGNTTPVEKGKAVKIQNRGPHGSFHGWTTLGTTATNTNGHYNKVLTLTCGKVYNLAAYVGKTSRNLANRSRVEFGVKPIN